VSKVEHPQVAAEHRAQWSVDGAKLSPAQGKAREIPENAESLPEPGLLAEIWIPESQSQDPVRPRPSSGGRSGRQLLLRLERTSEVGLFPLRLSENVPLVAEGVGFDPRPSLELRIEVGVVRDVADVEDAQGLLSGRDRSRQR
jgi:hypothetical protein